VNQRIARFGIIAATTLCGVAAHAQVADLLNTFDAGSRSSGLGSSLTGTDAEPLSTYNNPAALGYINHREISAAYRNLPRSLSTVSDANGSRSSTANSAGPSGITSLGFAFPLSSKSNRGTIGVSYNLGGYLDDFGGAQHVPYGNSATETAENYLDHMEAKTDYYSVGYGKTNSAQNLSYGISLLYARQYISYRQQFSVYDTSGNSPVLLSTQDTGQINGTSNGVGLVGGIEYVPTNMPSLTLGASLKSPIKLTGGGVSSYYDTIPGRLLLGGGYRLPGFKKRKDDYTVIGAQLEEYFGGSGSGLLAMSNFSSADAGVEYGFAEEDYTIPIRIGVRAISSEGPAFANRNELTYGFGFRDKDSRYGIDLSWTNPRGASKEFSVTASYRFVNP